MTATPDPGAWPDGRLGLIRVGDFAGCYLLAVPESDDRWLVYVGEDPEAFPSLSARHTDWAFSSSHDLNGVLVELDVDWLDGEEEAIQEQRVFDLRRRWSGADSGRRWMRRNRRPS